jgi:hypothetical protein
VSCFGFLIYRAESGVHVQSPVSGIPISRLDDDRTAPYGNETDRTYNCLHIQGDAQGRVWTRNPGGWQKKACGRRPNGGEVAACTGCGRLDMGSIPIARGSREKDVCRGLGEEGGCCLAIKVQHESGQLRRTAV